MDSAREAAVERKLKAELDFIKIYAAFIIGLAAGCTNLFFKFLVSGNEYVFGIFICGICVLITLFIFFIKSFYTINKLTKL